MREKYHITDEMVAFEPIPIIKVQYSYVYFAAVFYVWEISALRFTLLSYCRFTVTPVIFTQTSEYGDLSAITACDKFGVKSQNDSEQLEKAKVCCGYCFCAKLSLWSSISRHVLFLSSISWLHPFLSSFRFSLFAD